jgi:opacity protein-like surface antigen
LQKNVYSSRAVASLAAILLVVCITAFGQEQRNEISVQATGFFTKNADGNGLHSDATEAGGLLLGYRRHIFGRFSAEANYGWSRNTLEFSGATAGRVQSDIHQITGAAIVALPRISKFQPYVLGGGGALVFDPTGKPHGTFPGADRQARGTFLYGAGADYSLTWRISLRAEYRGFVYKTPDFGLNSLNTDKWTHTFQPSAGIVVKF